jgi:S-(hydroxymethyl)glutathione dehydrogenase/alcohol dehydrogenase
MKAAVIEEFAAPLVIENVDLDGPRAGEVRVRVAASGLCHSDYHVIKGDLPATVPCIAGHEAAGYVEAVGDGVTGIAPGDLVVTSFSAYCGHCVECQTGHNHMCADRPQGPARKSGSRITMNGEPVLQLADIGGFAEELVVHHRSVVQLPQTLSPDIAALLGCGVLTGVGAAINAARVTPGSKVAVVGCGGIGLNIIQGARIAGADEIIAVDLNPKKLAVAPLFGATAAVQAGPDAVKTVAEMTRGGVDFAFEAIGNTAAMRDAFRMLRMHGLLTVVGLAKPADDIAIPALEIPYKDARIRGSGMGDAPFQLFIPQLVRWYEQGRLKLDELISERIRLEEINDGYARMMTGEIARSVITF